MLAQSLENAYHCTPINVIKIKKNFATSKKILLCFFSHSLLPPLLPSNPWSVQMWVFIHFSKYFGEELLGHGKYMFNFNLIRNCPTVFQNGCGVFHFHQQCRRVLVAPHHCQHLVLLFFIRKSNGQSVTQWIIICELLKRGRKEEDTSRFLNR